MSRRKGSNRLTTAVRCAQAYRLWMKAFSRSEIAKTLGVSERMVGYYLAKWQREGKALSDLILDNKQHLEFLKMFDWIN